MKKKKRLITLYSAIDIGIFSGIDEGDEEGMIMGLGGGIRWSESSFFIDISLEKATVGAHEDIVLSIEAQYRFLKE